MSIGVEFKRGIDKAFIRLRLNTASRPGGTAGKLYFLHSPEFLDAGGSEAQLAALSDIGHAAPDAALFDELERAVLGLTIEMTRKVAVSDDAFTRIRHLMGDDRRLVELIGVVAAYNMVSRFLITLNIEPEQ